jgi:hypothetical protein
MVNADVLAGAVVPGVVSLKKFLTKVSASTAEELTNRKTRN